VSILSVILAAQAAAAPVPAVDKAPHYLKARDLLERCTTWKGGADYCYGYITSVYDTVRAYEAWLKLNEMCVPPGTSQGELVKTVVGHLRANPQEMESQAASVVVVALQRRFVCRAVPPAVKPN
jgi:hypothetical protein